MIWSPAFVSSAIDFHGLRLVFFGTIWKYRGAPGCLAKMARLSSGPRGKGWLRPLCVYSSNEEMSQKCCCATALLNINNTACPEMKDLGLHLPKGSFGWVNAEECKPQESSMLYGNWQAARAGLVVVHVWQEISHCLHDQSTGTETKTCLRQVSGGPKDWSHCLLLLQETRRWCYSQEKWQPSWTQVWLQSWALLFQLHSVLRDPEEGTRISAALVYYWLPMASKCSYLESLIFPALESLLMPHHLPGTCGTMSAALCPWTAKKRVQLYH